MRKNTTNTVVTTNVNTDLNDRVAGRTLGIMRSSSLPVRLCLQLRQVLSHLVRLAEIPAHQMYERCMQHCCKPAFKRSGAKYASTVWHRPAGWLCTSASPAVVFASMHS